MKVSSTQEQDWHALLAETRQKAALAKTVPLSTQVRQLKEQLLYYKKKLAVACREKQVQDSQYAFEQIIFLRGKLCTYTLQERKENGEIITSATMQEEVQKYIEDCTYLATVCDAFQKQTT